MDLNDKIIKRVGDIVSGFNAVEKMFPDASREGVGVTELAYRVAALEVKLEELLKYLIKKESEQESKTGG